MHQPKAVLASLFMLPALLLVNDAIAEGYSSNGIFGQVEHQGLKLTVAELGKMDSAATITGAAADFVMADGCLFASGHSTLPIVFDQAAARQRNIKASGEVIGYGYDACHQNRQFELKVAFNIDLSPLRTEGFAMTNVQNSLSKEGANTISQMLDADEMTARVNYAVISSNLTFVNSGYSFNNLVNPSQGSVGYLRDRRVLLSH